MKYQIKVKSLNKQSALLYQNFLKSVLEKRNIEFRIFNLPLKKKRITLLKSPHVNKSSREQFEIKFYSYILQIDKKLNSYLFKLLFLNKPKSVSLFLKS
jgi:ribosomal protein S10